jgi:hypothetical protein
MDALMNKIKKKIQRIQIFSKLYQSDTWEYVKR